jgi:hypothetical protein
MVRGKGVCLRGESGDWNGEGKESMSKLPHKVLYLRHTKMDSKINK